MFQLFRNVSKQNWNKLWKKWKYQAPFLVFQNTETMDYIGKKLKRTETGRKLTKSKCFSCFETKLKQALEKVKIPGHNVSVVSKQNWNKLWKKWKYQAPFLVFQNTETMDYIGKKLKRTETGRKLTKSKFFSCFETFRNKIETSSGKSVKLYCYTAMKQKQHQPCTNFRTMSNQETKTSQFPSSFFFIK